MARIRTVNPLTLREYKALVEGIPIYCPNATFVVAGQTFTATAAVTFISNVLNAVAATATAKGAWKDAIQVEDKLVAQDGATVKEIRNVIASMFSNAVNTLDAFEIAPRKPYVPLSADKRAAATAKARATRIARGTTSKKQKATLSGNVTGVVITPVTSSAATPAAGTASTVSAVATAPMPVVATASAVAPAAATVVAPSVAPEAPAPVAPASVTAK